MTRPLIRLAIVGCAGSVEAFRDAASRLREGAFVAAIDEQTALAKSMADATGASLIFASLDEALAAHENAFDAVVMRMPLAERATAVRRAAEAGKHVLADAPVAPSLRKAERVVNVSRGKEICMMLGGTLRFLASSQAIMSRLSEQKLGIPGLLRVHRWRGAGESGGAKQRDLSEEIVGDVDLANCIFAARPTRVYAIGHRAGSRASGYRSMPDYLQMHFGFPEGAMAVFDFATSLPSGQAYHSLHLIGSRGAAYADDHHNTHLLYRGDEPRARISGEGQLHTALELQEFVDAIVQRRPPAVSMQDGFDALHVVEAVGQSLDSSQVIHLNHGSYRADDEQ